MVDRLRLQLGQQGFGITLTEEARKLLAAEGFDSTLGARPLRRAIQRLLEDPLSEQLLAGHWIAGDVIEVFVENDRPAFRKGEGVVAVPSRVSVPVLQEVVKAAAPRRSSSRAGGGKASGGAAGE
jgi:ATP-dependent Clp protease ATP-binding subunit ClpC